VIVPANASAADRDRMRQLRVGDYVRVEVRPIDQQRAELVRFGWS
jgi:translation initiation factor IF-1